MDLRTVATLLLVLALAACGPPRQEETVDRPDIMSVVDTHAPRLIAIEGVAAIAVGALDSGEPCVRIYVVALTDALRAQLPPTLEGWPVVLEESGEIRPLDGS
ncbi:MAG: hypothetical protein R6X35_15495 [Candidatus Krumholzibacteriia bacterium]